MNKLAMQERVPSAQPDFCFLLTHKPSMSVFHLGKRCIFTFFSVFQMRATLTSVLFQLVCKKFPARSKVQNSPRCQNKFIPCSKPKMNSHYPLPKCIETLLSSHSSQNQLSSSFKWNLKNTFPLWKGFVYKLSNLFFSNKFRLNKIKLPMNAFKFSLLHFTFYEFYII